VPDAHALFDWLGTLSAMEHARHGLRPHDLVRDALDAELRWRHPDLRTRMRQRAATYYLRLFDDTDLDRQRAVLADYAYLHRESPVVGAMLASALSPAADEAMDRLTVGPSTPAELDALCATTGRHEGPESADLLRGWYPARPQFEPYSIRRRTPRRDTAVDTPAGFYALLWLTGTADADFDPDANEAGPGPGAMSPPTGDDPAVHAARRWLSGPGGLRAGEQALLVRYWWDADSHQGPSPVQLLITLRLTHHYLTARSPALTLLPFADPDAWAAGCAYVDFARLPQADFTVGGMTYGMFVHDWRRTPRNAWLRLLTARGASADPLSIPGPSSAAEPPVPDHDRFAAAVREALRHLDRADGLDGSALLESRLVRSRCDPDAGPRERVAALRAVIASAAAQLEASVTDRRAFRALQHTYLRPAGTQQRAADLLRLPMTTYRRHLAAGTDRLTALLWRQELSTEPPPPGSGPSPDV
jgi:hypothetical protein